MITSLQLAIMRFYAVEQLFILNQKWETIFRQAIV